MMMSLKIEKLSVKGFFRIFGLSKFRCPGEKQRIVLEKMSTCVVFLIEILMEEIKPVVVENWKIEYRSTSLQTALFWIFRLSWIYCMDRKEKSLLIEFYSANRFFSLEILVGETIPVVAEKYEFDYRNKSKTKTTNFWGFWLSGLW